MQLENHRVVASSLVFLTVVGCGAVAQAQVNRGLDRWVTASGSALNLTWDRPLRQRGDNGQLNCLPTTQGCTPINESFCSQNIDLPLRWTVANTSGAALRLPQSGTNVYVWWQNASPCALAPEQVQDPNIMIDQSQVRYFPNTPSPWNPGQGTAGFVVPDNLATVRTFGTQDLVRRLGVCDPNGRVDLRIYYLCIGIPATREGCINTLACQTGQTTPAPGTPTGTTNTGDTWIAAQFQVDTVPPPAPSAPEITSLRSRVHVKATYDAGVTDMYAIRVRYSSDPNNLTTPCAAWTANYQTAPDVIVYNILTGSAEFEIAGENGVQYAYCSQAIDYFQNVSKFSPSALGRPRPESDLFDVYPDDLQVGFCGAGLPPAWAAGTLLAVLWRMRRRGAKP
jgi:hypothetical protein